MRVALHLPMVDQLTTGPQIQSRIDWISNEGPRGVTLDTASRRFPDVLVELELETYRKPVFENPGCETLVIHFAEDRGEENGIAFGNPTVLHDPPCPLVVVSIRNDELDFTVLGKLFEVFHLYK